MFNKNKFSICLILIILSSWISFFLYTEITYKNEMYLYNSYYYTDCIVFNYLNKHPTFNYLNGLWLMPIGILFICILAIITDGNMPKLKKIYSILKNDLKTKLKNDFKK